MNIETELKLRILPQHLAQLIAHPLLQNNVLDAPRTQQLYNLYFDTPNLDLHCSEMALRLRRKGNRWIQTLKGGGAIQAGLHQRCEWEYEVADAALDFSHPMADSFSEIFPTAWRSQLQSVFVTDFSRNSRVINFQNAHIEVCIDQGEINAGGRSRDICELELELKSGFPQQLFALASAILDIVPIQIEVINKAEYGFSLLANSKPQINLYTPAEINPQENVSVQLHDVLSACLLHILKNLAAEKPDNTVLAQINLAQARIGMLLQCLQRAAWHKALDYLCAELALLQATHVPNKAQTGVQNIRELQAWMLRLAQLLQSDYWQQDAVHAIKFAQVDAAWQNLVAPV